MDLECATAFCSQIERMEEHIIGGSKDLRIYMIVRPPAFKGNGFSFLYIPGSAVKSGFHHGNCLFKTHAFGKAADLCRVNAEHSKDYKPGTRDLLCNP
jgi:hypothetical protein